jgi:serine O-acetyltransferase
LSSHGTRRLLAVLFVPRVLPFYILYKLSPNRHAIDADVARWVECAHVSPGLSMLVTLSWLMLYLPEFRNLFYYRLKKSAVCNAMSYIFSPLYPKMSTLHIATPEIGPGLFIQHGFATIICAKSIGTNCWINQQVTIGFSNASDCPVIGNNVSITAGAKVIGNVTIGDNSVVGANAVVVKDVPPSCTVVGVPAQIVRREGRRV